MFLEAAKFGNEDLLECLLKLGSEIDHVGPLGEVADIYKNTNNAYENRIVYNAVRLAICECNAKTLKFLL